MVDFYGLHVGKYTSPMDPSWVWKKLEFGGSGGGTAPIRALGSHVDDFSPEIHPLWVQATKSPFGPPIQSAYKNVPFVKLRQEAEANL